MHDIASFALLVAVVCSIGVHSYRRVVYYRYEQFKDFPHPPVSMVWGSLKAVGQAMGAIGGRSMHAGMYADVTLLLVENESSG